MPEAGACCQGWNCAARWATPLDMWQLMTRRYTRYQARAHLQWQERQLLCCDSAVRGASGAATALVCSARTHAAVMHPSAVPSICIRWAPAVRTAHARRADLSGNSCAQNVHPWQQDRSRLDKGVRLSNEG